MYLVFDIGGTHMRIGVSSDGSTITESKIVPTSQDFDQGILVLKQTADELSGGEKINVVAGGIPGPLDKGKSMLVTCPQLHGWIQKPLKAELEKAYGTKVYLENDTAIGGIGEAVKGAGAGKKIVAYLAMGTGIGGTRIVDQRVDSNNLGFEPGHQIVDFDWSAKPELKKLNEIEGFGQLEAYISGASFEKIYKIALWVNQR